MLHNNHKKNGAAVVAAPFSPFSMSFTDASHDIIVLYRLVGFLHGSF